MNEALTPYENAVAAACEARFDLHVAENALTQAVANLEAAKSEREAAMFVLEMLANTGVENAIAVRNQWGLVTPYTMVRCNRHVEVCEAAVEAAKERARTVGQHFGEMMFTAGQCFGERNETEAMVGQ